MSWSKIVKRYGFRVKDIHTENAQKLSNVERKAESGLGKPMPTVESVGIRIFPWASAERDQRLQSVARTGQCSIYSRMKRGAMSMLRNTIGGFVVLFSIAGSAPAQSPVPNAPGCEVHVWPGTDYETGSTGWSDSFGGGVLGAALDASGHLDRRLTTAIVFQQKFDPTRQAAIMKSFGYSSFIHSDAAAIVESSPFDAKQIANVETRGAISTAPCYIEIYVLKNRYYYAPLPGKQFQTTFLIKDFRPAKPRIFRDLKITKIKIFPALEPAQEQPAVQELEQAFLNNLNHFAERVFGPRGSGTP